MPNRILISVADPQDLRNGDIPGGKDNLTPLYCLLQEGYDHLFLIHAVHNAAMAKRIAEEVGVTYPRMKLCTLELEPFDLAQSRQVMLQMQEVLNDVRTNNPGADIHVSLSSGPAEIHVAWLSLLTSNGNQSVSLVRSSNGLSAIDVDGVNGQEAEMHRQVNPTATAESLGLIGGHHLFEKALCTARMMARHSIPVLISGDPGTGKTVFTRYIHAMSRAESAPIEEFATAGGAVSDAASESILFGGGSKHGRGAQHQPGLVSLATGGTLVIDQPELLGIRVQERLLALIQGRNGPTNVRLIFTTPQNLAGSHEGALLPELARHLLENRIELPRLSARPSDIPVIANYYLERVNEQSREPKTITPETLVALQKLNWPENIRSLREAVERAALLSQGSELTLSSILSGNGATDIVDTIMPDLSRGIPLDAFLAELRKKIMNKALEMAKGNKSEAARMLHLTPQALSQFAKQQAKGKAGKQDS